jgi:C1A family cysteine protease
MEIKQNEEALLDAVGNLGPVAVGINMIDSLRHYKRGIFDETSCKSDKGHAVLVVGYGTEGSLDFWIVKNSWVSSAMLESENSF